MSTSTQFVSCGSSENLRTAFNDLRAFVVSLATGNYCRTDPTLAEGTSSKKTVKASPFTFNILGMPYAHAGAETAFTATTHDCADGYTRTYTIEVPATGTIIITPGTAVLTANVANVPSAAPATTAAHAKVGEVKVAADGAIFNASSDDLDAGHLTVTYTDFDYVTQTTGFALTDS